MQEGKGNSNQHMQHLWSTTPADHTDMMDESATLHSWHNQMGSNKLWLLFKEGLLSREPLLTIVYKLAIEKTYHRQCCTLQNVLLNGCCWKLRFQTSTYTQSAAFTMVSLGGFVNTYEVGAPSVPWARYKPNARIPLSCRRPTKRSPYSWLMYSSGTDMCSKIRNRSELNPPSCFTYPPSSSCSTMDIVFRL